jgi:polyhydroxybutyrate depolymerase
MRHAMRSGVTALLAGAVWLAGQLPALAYDLRIATRDGVRSVLVLPARRTPAPTVIVLHGIAISASWTSRISGFAEAASARGFTSVYPEGLKMAWNDGRDGVVSPADDVGFLRKLVHELSRRNVADPERIYIAGISNGGMMALRMLCEASELFAGAGTVIASMPKRTGTSCHIARPVPIVMINGSADLVIPYNGGWVGPFGVGGEVWGAEKTAGFVARANGCATVSRTHFPSHKPFDHMSVTRTAWGGCLTPGKAVTLYRVNGGGHQIFGRRGIIASMLGGLGPDISAAETIMGTFETAPPRRDRIGARGTPGHL